MLAGDIITNYTDHQYLSKSELVMALGTSLIDPFWIRIEEYRRNNAIFLDLSSISRIPFSLTLTPMIAKKIEDVSDGKFDQLKLEFDSLDAHTNLKAQIVREFAFPCLKAISDIEHLALSDVAIKAVISKNNNGNNPNEVILSHYLDCLSYVQSHQGDEINEEFLASLWGLMLGESELTEFYRSTDSVNKYSLIQVNRDDFEAPSKEIEALMDRLFNFIAGESCNPFQKALATLYFVFYVKPFSRYNEAIASLFAKAILLKEGYGESILYFPLESILRSNFPKFKTTFLNVQRYNDLTYFILNSLEYIDRSADAMVSSITKAKSKMMDEEREVATPSDIGFPKVEEKLVPQKTLQNEPIDNDLPPIEVIKPVKEEVREEPRKEPVITPKVEPIKPIQKEEVKPSVQETPKASPTTEKKESPIQPSWQSTIEPQYQSPFLYGTTSYVMPSEIFQQAPEMAVKEDKVEAKPEIKEESKPETKVSIQEEIQPSPQLQMVEEKNNSQEQDVEHVEPQKEETSIEEPFAKPVENAFEERIEQAPSKQAPSKVEEKEIQQAAEPLPKHEQAEAPLFPDLFQDNKEEKAPAPKPSKPKEDIPYYDELPNRKEGPDRVAYNKAEHIYSDKEMREYAKYLLETHPNLKRHQAYFYSCHATVGRYYTIQDFKRYAKCVYETARTSMENLVKEGLYQKIQVKNKFVYTPYEGEKK